jgi:hypothetical protein
VADFGFYADGYINVSWNNSPGNAAYSVSLQALSNSRYDDWFDELYDSNAWHDCHRDGSVGNVTTVLSSTSQSGQIVIPETGVFVAIVQHCSSNLSGRYSLDVVFMNPNGQHLDSRDIPSLTVLPIMIGIFGVVLLGWIGLILLRRYRFLAIHVCIGVIVLFHILYLAFYEGSL